MRPPMTITLTGVDMTTDIDAAIDLAMEHPCIEYGLLLSRSQAGQPGRYGSFEFISAAARRFFLAGVPMAIHVCGSAVHALLDGDKEIEDVAAPFGRVQLNFNAARTPVDPAALDAYIARIDRYVITQHNEGNREISSMVRSPYHQVLFDSSGGFGRRAESWPLPLPGKSCGYAGGIGPRTVAADLDAISSLTDYWIDMEASLRTEDRFDLDLCRQVVETARTVLERGPTA